MDSGLKQFVARQRERFENAQVDQEIETVKRLVSNVKCDEPIRTIRTQVRLSDKTLKKLAAHGLVLKPVYLPPSPPQIDSNVLYGFTFSTVRHDVNHDGNKRRRQNHPLTGWRVKYTDSDDEYCTTDSEI